MTLTDFPRGYVWQKYLNYLTNWVYDHADGEFCGMSPASFDEWLDDEETEEDEILKEE